MFDEKLYKDLKEGINEIKIFDTHEHLIFEVERRTKKLDFFIFFRHYASTDLVSSGLSLKNLEKLRNPGIDLEVKWNIFFPYWEYIKNTTYSKAINIIAKDIYGVEDIDLEGIKKITKKINEFNSIEYYEDILRKKSKIEFILNDIDKVPEDEMNIKDPDKDYFLPIMCLDDEIELKSIENIEKIEEKNDININGFSDFLNFIDDRFDKRKNKIYGLKIGTAYRRNLSFEDVTNNEAEKSFLKVLKLKNYDELKESISLSEIKPFQDFSYHYLIKKAIKYNIPIQIHTGMLEGNANDIRNSNPTCLTNLILKYRKAKFDLFHIGYPYTDELIAMIKIYQNCYINMCWIAQISKELYKNTLRMLIDIIPSNKIFGFGGDYMFVEGTYAAQKIAREAITEVLYEKILNEYFSFKDAIGFAKRMLNHNPRDVYLK